MSNRFKLISRRILAERGSPLRFGNHVGVYDERYEEVLDLGFNEEDNSIIIRISSLEEFKQGEQVRFELIEGMSSESEIESRWHAISSAWKNSELNHLKFNLYSLNCETLAYFVLTGRENTPQGEELNDLIGEMLVGSLRGLANILRSWSSD
ncbi:hypothetical protein Ple7327_3003 [Pleurocapsa sp. PCC 7327]|uniref:hypothetical protein n=1 Tax=Pleurocapsa sp. PCC 7327 TaxID=118163 RepID=UPI00029FE218|nr:hypothetical protein [Pleurocapsa sp. PCC 7327]AFY78237.1 hypothetical protein Ple7327_3003 [Pleurocapsa sp. PCC 7327]